MTIKTLFFKMAVFSPFCVKLMVYFTIFLNITGGFLCFFRTEAHNISNSSPNVQTIAESKAGNVTTGVVAICLGLLLLYGVMKREALCVLAYLILMFIGAVINTILALFLFGSLVVHPWTGILVLFLLVLVWIQVYCVFLFYKELKNEDNTRSTSGDVEATFHTVKE